MSEPLLLGIDEGTTAVKAALFDTGLRRLAEARRPVATSHPGQGRVEQDPEEVLAAVIEAVADVLAQAPAQAQVLAGLAHQGESVLAWDAHTLAPLTPIVVWQDKRQEQLLAEIDPESVRRSGLPLDPYFSAGKLAWLLRHDRAVADARARGALRMGTVDVFLAQRLGGRFATDLSTASRTQLLALGGEDWDPQLLAAFEIERTMLPALGPTFGPLGALACEQWKRPLELCAQLVDQQAALAGSGTVSVGEVKATYGTGVFVLGRIERPEPVPGLLPTVAWGTPSTPAYALDGGVFTAGALLEWLARDLGLAADPPALARAAAGVPDAAGVMVLPALAGLGAPWWRSESRGVIAGLHGGVRPAHLARAALEAIAARVVDVVEAFVPAVQVRSLRVDGGLSNEPLLMRLQADALGLPLEVGSADATVLGAALLAGVGGGVFESIEQAAALLPQGRLVEPQVGERERAGARQRWRRFVEAAGSLP
ncbi:MAG TPA: FGGY family carbohydrate kinase [Solirubrobacteraceae bacterium]|jgi:glycerol kinase